MEFIHLDGLNGFIAIWGIKEYEDSAGKLCGGGSSAMILINRGDSMSQTASSCSCFLCYSMGLNSVEEGTANAGLNRR